MYTFELNQVSRKLKRLLKKNYLKKKELYLFGASDNSRQIIKLLRENGYYPCGIIDNDPKKRGSFCMGLRVMKVEEIPSYGNVVCLVYSFYWREMKRQLLNLGLGKKQVIVLAGKEKKVLARLKEAYKGKKLYHSIKKKYKDALVFLCPYTGTGDIYLIGMFWNEYVKKEKLDNYVFVVINSACKKVAQLFDIKNIEVLSNQKDSEYLIRYYSLCTDSVKIKILNDAWAQINDNTSEWFRGYKGWYFTELFRKFVFDLPENSKPVHPMLKDVSREVTELFEKFKLKEGKTVILSPYSNTLADLPINFWEIICDRLKKKGYFVCTNSIGPSEVAIKGSTAVFFPLDIAPQFVDKAGTFIGVRSGLCDVISGTSAKKIILYDKGNRFYNCSAFEYFSLNAMGLCQDAIEIQYDNLKFYEIVNAIEEYC